MNSQNSSKGGCGQDHIRYECDVCGNRFATVAAPNTVCESCGRSEDVLTEIDPVPKNAIQIYCENCSFEEVVYEDDAYFPERLAEARAKLHSSQRQHPIQFEYSSQWPDVTGEDEQRICGCLGSEEELQIWLKTYFEGHGWDAMREVKPAHSSVRADLIVKHEKYGWIGIEAKYFKRDGGGKAAKAHHQITRKYRGKKYAGRNKIDLWAICPYFHGRNNERNRLGYRPHQQRANMIREMFCKHGIGYIDLTRSELLIDFSFSKANSKIPVKDDEESRHYENVDADAIRENVQDKMEEYDYR